jgi:hypothetical protein
VSLSSSPVLPCPVLPCPVLPLSCPVVESKSQKYARSKPRLTDQCAIRVDAKLIYSKVSSPTVYPLDCFSCSEHEQVALWKNRIEEIEGKIKELEHSPPQDQLHIRPRPKKGGRAAEGEFNKETVEFNQAKKIERKIMKSMHRPLAPAPAPAPASVAASAAAPHVTSTTTKKTTRRRSSHGNELSEESKFMKEAEEGLPPPDEERSSAPKTPPPNLSIFRGGVVSDITELFSLSLSVSLCLISVYFYRRQIVLLKMPKKS